MSNKHKSQKDKKKNVPWFLLALGGMLMVIAAFFSRGRMVLEVVHPPLQSISKRLIMAM
jgi:uncharacterized membrane protein YadS